MCPAAGGGTLRVLLGGLFGMSKIWWQLATMISQDRCCRPKGEGGGAGLRGSGLCWLLGLVLRRGVSRLGDTPAVGLWAEFRWGFCPVCPRVFVRGPWGDLPALDRPASVLRRGVSRLGYTPAVGVTGRTSSGVLPGMSPGWLLGLLGWRSCFGSSAPVLCVARGFVPSRGRRGRSRRGDICGRSPG